MTDTFTQIHKEFEFINRSANLTTFQLNQFEDQVKSSNISKYKGQNIDISLKVTDVTKDLLTGNLEFGGMNPTAYYELKCSLQNTNVELSAIHRGDYLNVSGRILDISVELAKRYDYSSQFGYGSVQFFFPRIRINLELIQLQTPKSKNSGCLSFITLILSFCRLFI